MTRRRGGKSKRERPISPVISSLSFLHSLEHPNRFTELSREEKRRGREEIEVTLGRKRRVKRGENNQASHHPPR